MPGHRRGPTLYYRCRATDLVASRRADHPSTVCLREDGLVTVLDTWLQSVLDPDQVAATVEHVSASGENPLAEDGTRHAITALLDDADQRLNRFKAALAQGADPAVVSNWVNAAQADLAKGHRPGAAQQRGPGRAQPF